MINEVGTDFKYTVILEPSCNMDFVTVVTKITKDGKIYSKQFEDSFSD